MAPADAEAVVPWRVQVSATALVDLRERLARTRWPSEETVADWSQGVPSAYLRELCRFWAQDYDWRRVEARLNALPQIRTTIDGVGIHAVHVRSPHPEAVPLLLTHGWPGSILEFLDVIGPLVDPSAHGGEAADAFHVVCPSLPGYGFSDAPSASGWGVERTARAWAVLMSRLGYDRFAAQGGDWGASVTTSLALQVPDRLIGMHLTWAVLPRRMLLDLGEPTAEERANLEALERHRAEDSGYAAVQSTRPQSVGYGLADSPAGQCAWIVEKFRNWSDCDGHPENAFSRDALLDNVSLYWLTNTAASSARMYWESFGPTGLPLPPVTVPTAYSGFPRDIACFSRRWVAARYTDVRYHRLVDRGGHFAAFERPEAFVDEVRRGLRTMR